MKTRADWTGLDGELADVALGDARLNARALKIAARIEEAPAESFPEQMEDCAELEGVYRFLANDSVSADALLAPHVAQTLQRLDGHEVVRIVHDTTTFAFAGDREGLAHIGRGSGQGFFGHVALAVSSDESREPLGVLGLHTFTLAKTAALRGMTPAQRTDHCRATPRVEKIASRWERLAIDVDALVPTTTRAVHVMDREADDYALLGEMQIAGVAFVIRGAGDRRLGRGDVTIAESLSRHPASLFRSVFANARREGASRRTKQPRRLEREANLSIRWGEITLKRRAWMQSEAATLSINAVHVFEERPPVGEEPIEWLLYTSEPVTCLDDAATVVDHYRARWLVEEFFKALKTGCAFEKRQLTTYDALRRALALFIPMAWRLLTLRQLARESPPRPASAVFDSDELLLLRAMAAKRKRALPDEPSAHDAMLGVAAIGGHIRNNGDPGWLVLGRGFRKFLEAREGWEIARRYDQS